MSREKLSYVHFRVLRQGSLARLFKVVLQNLYDRSIEAGCQNTNNLKNQEN